MKLTNKHDLLLWAATAPTESCRPPTWADTVSTTAREVLDEFPGSDWLRETGQIVRPEGSVSGGVERNGPDLGSCLVPI